MCVCECVCVNVCVYPDCVLVVCVCVDPGLPAPSERFSRVLLEKVGLEQMKTWVHVNRGAMVLCRSGRSLLVGMKNAHTLFCLRLDVLEESLSPSPLPSVF